MISKVSVLVIIVGINRCFDLVAPSINQFLLGPILTSRWLNPRIVLHLAEDGLLANPRSNEFGELRTSEQFGPYIHEVHKHSLREIRQETSEVAIHELGVTDTWNDDYKSVLAVFEYQRLLARAAISIGDESVVVITRPDVLWNKRFHSLIPLLLARWISLFPRWGRFGGLNDRFAILPKSMAMKFLSQEKALPGFMKKRSTAHLETFLSELFKGFPTLSVLRPRFVRVRLNGSVEIRDFQQQAELVGHPIVRGTLIDCKRRLGNLLARSHFSFRGQERRH